MKRIFFVVICFLILAFVSTACRVTKIEPDALGGMWVLQAMDGVGADSLFGGNVPNLQFDMDKGLVFGKGGCNRYMGGFHLGAKNQFSAPHLASTMMMCLNENKESLFFKLLSSDNLFVSLSKKGTLVFLKHKKPVLVFCRDVSEQKVSIALQNRDIADSVHIWRVLSFERDGHRIVFQGKSPSMCFVLSGMVHGCAGCNRYRSSYVLKGDSIRMTLPMMTRMACPDLQNESKFIQFITSPLSIVLVHGKLVLRHSAHSVMVLQKEVK